MKVSTQSAAALFNWVEYTLTLEFLSSNAYAHKYTLLLMDSIIRIMVGHWESNHNLTIELLSRGNLLSMIPKLKYEHIMCKEDTPKTELTEIWFNEWSLKLNKHPMIDVFNRLSEMLIQVTKKAEVCNNVDRAIIGMHSIR